MGDPYSPNRATFQRRRAERFKARADAADKKVAKLRRELREVHRDRFIEGSAMATADAFAALGGDTILAMWLSQRMMACRTRCPPYHLPPETEKMVRTEISAHLKKCGITSVDVSEIEL